ncbi:MAG: hypothetical protein MUF55_03620 [Hydrogenophaga sp.]|jgi:hypothetical protein|nr:hypothetical protein [Hydrogenophaga sp.]
MNSPWWRRFFSSAAGASHAAPAPALVNDVDNPPDRVEATGISPLMFKPLLQMSEGLPRPDWDMVTAWIASIPDHSEQAAAWGRCEIAWLQHLQSALGQRYRLRMTDEVALLSTLDDVTAKATLAFVARSRERIARTLAGLAQVPEWGYDIVLVLDDEDTYYRYASHHYPDEGEFAISSGMYLGGACGHFITVKNQLQSIEPTIVHELTHALLGHLPIPAWLNEGLAVNTEHRFYPPVIGSHRGGYDAALQHARHQKFWGLAEIQQFWSGDSFDRTDQGNELSYDLARILTAHFATDWQRFTAFALEAHHFDGGAQAARERLGISLGSAVCALLEREYTPEHEPHEQTVSDHQGGPLSGRRVLRAEDARP